MVDWRVQECHNCQGLSRRGRICSTLGKTRGKRHLGRKPPQTCLELFGSSEKITRKSHCDNGKIQLDVSLAIIRWLVQQTLLDAIDVANASTKQDKWSSTLCQTPLSFSQIWYRSGPAWPISPICAGIFRWCREKLPGVDLPNTYNNFARFYIFPNQSLSLVLLCHSSTIEVVVLSVKSAIDVVDVDSIRAFRNQLTSIIERVWKKFFWVKNVGCEVSFLCPVCSHGRVVSFCPRHRKESCMQEECLHFISESDLGDEKQAVCTNSATALDNSIHAEQFALWISSGKEKVRKNVFLLACMN